MIVVEYI